jgi:hypothetical protein
MPTVLIVRGWRLFFYANENDEPIHIHAQKAETECKFWLKVDIFDIGEEWSHRLSPRLRREIRKIIFDHFELIVDEWNRFFGVGNDAED